MVYACVRVPGYQGNMVLGYQGTRVPGYQGTRVPGYQGTRIPRTFAPMRMHQLLHTTFYICMHSVALFVVNDQSILPCKPTEQ